MQIGVQLDAPSLKALFHHYDLDGSGVLAYNEVLALCASVKQGDAEVRERVLSLHCILKSYTSLHLPSYFSTTSTRRVTFFEPTFRIQLNQADQGRAYC
jgi:hypothetical protein